MLATMKAFLCALCVSVALSCAKVRAAEEGKQMDKGSKAWMYIGSRGGKGGGIFRATFDLNTGAIGPMQPETDVTSGSFMALDSKQQRMFVVGEAPGPDGKGRGTLSSFDIDPSSGTLKLINQQDVKGKGPCHLAVDEKGGHVIIANYSVGSVSALPVDKSGRLAEATALVLHSGKGPNPKRQEMPHAHCTTIDPIAKTVVVADLGTDKVILYPLPDASGKLPEEKGAPYLSVAPGTGPRHVAFSRDGKFLYVLGELISTVTVFQRDAGGKGFNEVQVISSLPDDYKGINWPSEITVHPSGKFLYASNRVFDSIAIFAIDQVAGKLTLKGQAMTQGKNPRHFQLDPAGKFLIAANQDGNNLVVFAIDQDTGALTPTGVKADVPTPFCVIFVPQP